MSYYENIPKKHSLGSMEGVNELDIILDQFELSKRNFEFIVKVEEAVKKSLGKFDIFDFDFFSEVYKQRELLRDQDPCTDEIYHGFNYISLDIFDRLLEKGLLNEEDREIFCFGFIDSHFLQREIERYLRHKNGLLKGSKPEIGKLRMLVEKYLPNIETLASLENIEEIDTNLREECFKIKLAGDFTYFLIRENYHHTINNWDEQKEIFWKEFIDKKWNELSKKYPDYILKGFPGLYNIARHIIVDEGLEIINNQFTITINWRDIIMKGFDTLGGEKELDIYSIKRLRDILLGIKAEYHF